MRIAKENLLGRWIKWTEKDEFIPADNAAISYATLIGERVTLTNCVFDDISAAITITLRYSVVRKQGPLFILDYQPHYYRLLPILSSLYAVLFTSKFYFYFIILISFYFIFTLKFFSFIYFFYILFYFV